MAAIDSDAFKGGLGCPPQWVKMVSNEAGPPDPDQNLLRKNARLWREGRGLKV